jgi:glucose-6-phosphate-specific signal transduction histidine kinase
MNRWWSWKPTADDLNEQVTNYSDLSIVRSYRGQVVIFFLCIFVVSLAISILLPEVLAPDEVILTFIIYAVLVWFGYRGHRWALIALLIFWAIDKLTTIYFVAPIRPRSTFSSILFLVMGSAAILRALKVATERKRRLSQSTQAA